MRHAQIVTTPAILVRLALVARDGSVEPICTCGQVDMDSGCLMFWSVEEPGEWVLPEEETRT
jgi:hypothetical protein